MIFRRGYMYFRGSKLLILDSESWLLWYLIESEGFSDFWWSSWRFLISWCHFLMISGALFFIFVVTFSRATKTFMIWRNFQKIKKLAFCRSRSSTLFYFSRSRANFLDHFLTFRKPLFFKINPLQKLTITLFIKAQEKEIVKK